MAHIEQDCCAGCGYDLAGLGQSGRCPECGGFFSRRSGEGIGRPHAPAARGERIKLALVAVAAVSLVLGIMGCTGLLSWISGRPNPVAIGGLVSAIVLLAVCTWFLEQRSSD